MVLSTMRLLSFPDLELLWSLEDTNLKMASKDGHKDRVYVTTTSAPFCGRKRPANWVEHSIFFHCRGGILKASVYVGSGD